jgi:hypothetical protein
VFILLLLVADSLAGLLSYGILDFLRPGGRLVAWPDAAFPAGQQLSDVLRWLLAAAGSFRFGIGLFAPLLIGLGGLLRFFPLRAAIVVIAVYQVAAAMLGAAATVSAMLQYAAQGATFTEGFWLATARAAVAQLTVGVLPVLSLVCVFSTDRLPQAPPQLAQAARLTRLILLAWGALRLWFGAFFVLELVAENIAGPSTLFAPIGLVGAANAMLVLAWGAILLACGLQLVRRQRVWRSWLGLAAIADLAAWIVVTGATLPWYYLTGLPGMLGMGGFCRFAVRVAVQIGQTLPVTAVIVWFWWPVLVGRVPGDLQPESPACANCGYCLAGNVSGRCPECGHPVPRVAG